LTDLPSRPMDDLMEALALARDSYLSRRQPQYATLFLNRVEWDWMARAVGGDEALLETFDALARAHGFDGANPSVWIPAVYLGWGVEVGVPAPGVKWW